jgi:hypothetical protein
VLVKRKRKHRQEERTTTAASKNLDGGRIDYDNQRGFLPPLAASGSGLGQSVFTKSFPAPTGPSAKNAQAHPTTEARYLSCSRISPAFASNYSFFHHKLTLLAAWSQTGTRQPRQTSEQGVPHQPLSRKDFAQ